MTISSSCHIGLAQRDCAPRKSHGFTLLEVLIAALVLSIGLLGAVSLGLATLRTHREAIYQSRAVSLSGDMAERIRSNREGRSDYGGAGSDRECSTDTQQGRMCSPTEMAEHDLFEWKNEIVSSLPAGAGRIENSPDGALPGYRITIEWQVGQITRQRSLDIVL
jgi:type IV pilus assembly protein PilV